MAPHPNRCGIWVVLCALLAGCTSMTGSMQFDLAGTRSGLGCSGTLGAYSLARKQIKVLVNKLDDTKPFGLEVSEGKYISDHRHIYCLDFLASLVADERIGIKRDAENALLLERVYTKSVDKTLENAKKLVQAGADFTAFNRAEDQQRATFGSAVLTVANTVREFNIDPFDHADMQKVNSALRPFGYCIYLRAEGDKLVPDWSDHLCSGDTDGEWRTRVKGQTKTEGPSYARIVDSRPVPDEVKQRGIFYRPDITHILVVMKQDHPGKAGAPWYRAGSMRVSLPNASPPFLLRVERSLFTKAETDITFKNGALESIAVDRESELKAVSNFAVEVVQIVQKIPAVTLAIFSNAADNRQALIKTNQELIKTLQEYNVARSLPPGDPRLLTPGANAVILQGAPQPQRSAEDDAIATCMQDPAFRGKKDAMAECRRAVRDNL